MKKKITYTLFALLFAITASAQQSAYAKQQAAKEAAQQQAAKATAQQSAVSKKSNEMNVGVMLPLHNVDGDGRRMVEYYRGLLLGINQLKHEGMNINVRAWNVNIDADPRTTLLDEGAAHSNIIFGPLYTKQVKAIADFCRNNNIQMVIPFSISGNDVDTNPCIYQVYETDDDMNTQAVKHVADNFKGYHFVFIDCNDSTSKKGTFTLPLRKSLESQGTQYNITNLKSSMDQFVKAFSTAMPNLVILNTGRSPEMRAALDKLDALLETSPNLFINVFGYKEWLMYTKYNKDRFSKYNAYIPTNFYYNPQSTATQQFVKNYQEAYGEEMMNALPHFALTGYDHAMYFMGKKNQWLQSPLKFQKTPNGGYRNKTFMLIHYKNDGNIDAIQY